MLADDRAIFEIELVNDFIQNQPTLLFYSGGNVVGVNAPGGGAGTGVSALDESVPVWVSAVVAISNIPALAVVAAET